MWWEVERRWCERGRELHVWDIQIGVSVQTWIHLCMCWPVCRCVSIYMHIVYVCVACMWACGFTCMGVHVLARVWVYEYLHCVCVCHMYGICRFTCMGKHVWVSVSAQRDWGCGNERITLATSPPWRGVTSGMEKERSRKRHGHTESVRDPGELGRWRREGQQSESHDVHGHQTREQTGTVTEKSRVGSSGGHEGLFEIHLF